MLCVSPRRRSPFTPGPNGEREVRAVPTDQELSAQLKTLSEELDRRTRNAERLRPYDEGGCPIPDAVVRGKLTKAYRSLMPTSEAPWGSLIVDSVQDRLEVAGLVDSENEDAAKTGWGLWQDNSMDAESKLAHRSALLDGRAFAMVWPDETNQPAVSLDDCTQMVVQYREGSRRHHVAALRRWVDGTGAANATLYRPDGIYKFARPRQREGQVVAEWKLRDGQSVLPNPLKAVPVVELAVNRRLKPGPFPYARGEFEHCTGLIDRINLLTFFGLVVALWMGFPLRGVIGEKILRDDDGKILPPFDSKPDSVVQFENPEAKVFQLDAADRKNLSVFDELEQLAAISKTPKHYFPMGGGIANIAEPTIRAFEGALHAKVSGHQASLGESWEEVDRLCCAMLPEPVQLSSRAEVDWKDHESRSLAERADAFVKIASVDNVPFLMAAELALNATGDQLARWQSMGMGTVLDELLRAPTNGSQPVAA